VSAAKKYRSRSIQQSVIAFSISYQRDNLLARGMGLEHLRELLIRLARPILRQGASLAYGGSWKETEDNFTYDLLRLISAEQEDNSAGGPDTDLQIGILYNHSAWPYYLDISRTIEARWVNACRIVRITQQMAGFADSDIVADQDFQNKTPRAIFNAAATLSAMRRLMMAGTSINIPGGAPENIPPVIARILLGGRSDGFSGFLPGLFEETLVTLESERPVYILGGFGGAAETLAKVVLTSGSERPKELTSSWLAERNPSLGALLKIAANYSLPPMIKSTESSLDALFKFLNDAQANPSEILRTGLSDDDTRELMRTRSVATAVQLVRKGLIETKRLPPLPA
jgi:hypothetical protein